MPVQIIDDPTQAPGYNLLSRLGVITNFFMKKKAEDDAKKALQVKDFQARTSGMSPYEASQLASPNITEQLPYLQNAQASPADLQRQAIQKKQADLLEADPSQLSLEDWATRQKLEGGAAPSADAYKMRMLQMLTDQRVPEQTKQAIRVQQKLEEDANTQAKLQQQGSIADQNQQLRLALATMAQNGLNSRAADNRNAAMDRLVMTLVAKTAQNQPQTTLPDIAGQAPAPGAPPPSPIQPPPAGGAPQLHLSPDTIAVLRNPKYLKAIVNKKGNAQAVENEINALSQFAGVSLTPPSELTGDEEKRWDYATTALQNVDRISKMVDYFWKAKQPITGPAYGRMARAHGRVGTGVDWVLDAVSSLTPGEDAPPERTLTTQERNDLAPLLGYRDPAQVPNSFRTVWRQAQQQLLGYENYLSKQEAAATLPRPAREIIHDFDAVGPNSVQDYYTLQAKLNMLREHATGIKWSVGSKQWGGAIPRVLGDGRIQISTDGANWKTIGRL